MKLNLSKFFQLRWNVFFFRLLPYSAGYVYMQMIGKLYYMVRRKEKRLIERNIRDMMRGKSRKELQRIYRRSFEGIFAHYFEKMYSAFKDIKEIRRLVEGRFTIENGHILDEALRRDKGVILVTAHWGAVEFIPWALALKGYPVSVILECQTPHLARSLKKRAAKLGTDLISSADGQSVYGRALESLQSNRLLMTECDEVDAWRKKKGRTIRLFDKTLFFDNTLDLMAQRSGAPVVGVFLKRVSPRRFTLICEPINNGRAANRTATRALHLWQKYVTRFPEQWYQWKKWGAMKSA